HKIRSSDVTVLVTGESGTGKELVARAIHALSTRRDKVFVPFNCTAVPKELTEGYLFGYRRGAFTGAIKDSDGVIRTAAGGTLFLDEIGDLSIDVQPKLLRFLQEGEIQPLGEVWPSRYSNDSSGSRPANGRRLARQCAPTLQRSAAHRRPHRRRNFDYSRTFVPGAAPDEDSFGAGYSDPDWNRRRWSFFY